MITRSSTLGGMRGIESSTAYLEHKMGYLLFATWAGLTDKPIEFGIPDTMTVSFAANYDENCDSVHRLVLPRKNTL